MRYINAKILTLLLPTILAYGCNPDDDKNKVEPKPEEPVVTYHFYVSGKMDGVPFYWKVDTTTYKQSLASYNPRNVSTSNNYIRYGTSITPATTTQVPYIGVEFNGFLGNTMDRLSIANFQKYFKLGNYPFSNAANKDTEFGINIIYEKDQNYTDLHQSMLVAQPSTSFFTVDTLSFVQKTTNHAYLKARFAATLKNNNGTDADIVITDGEFRIFVDNSLEE